MYGKTYGNTAPCTAKAPAVHYTAGKVRFARLAETYADAYLPMDDILREAHLENPAEYAADGIHPTPDGAMLIGEAYLRAVAPLIEACEADGERD